MTSSETAEDSPLDAAADEVGTTTAAGSAAETHESGDGASKPQAIEDDESVFADDPDGDDREVESAGDDEESAAAPDGEAESAGDEEEESAAAPDTHAWYVLKVQSNQENSIREAMLKRLKIAGLDEFVSEIVIPTEKVTEIKSGKKRVTERKFYPGYVMIRLELNDDVWFAIRETPGVGDFVGSGGKPVPMTDDDVARMLGRKEAVEHAGPRLKIDFAKGDRVKIKQGHTFENFEGEVEEVIEGKGLVRVMIQIFGRPTPVELEYWQVENV